MGFDLIMEYYSVADLNAACTARPQVLLRRNTLIAFFLIHYS
jgi:hypothetical protein